MFARLMLPRMCAHFLLLSETHLTCSNLGLEVCAHSRPVEHELGSGYSSLYSKMSSTRMGMGPFEDFLLDLLVFWNQDLLEWLVSFPFLSSDERITFIDV